MRYRLQRHDGTDCSATMVPITVLRMVPIQRYRHNNNSLKIFSETLLDKLNTEYLDEVYDIQNVTISRKFFSLTINTNNRIKEYSIPIDAYSFLKDLKVFDEVTIRKDTHTEKVFVNWPWIGYEIPLEEFKVSSYQ